MCGIALALLQESLPPALTSLIWERLTASASPRGPDVQDALIRPLSQFPGTLHAFGATLWMRGALTKQPLQSASNPQNFLLFNGEIFGGLTVNPGDNDGQTLLQKLEAGSDADVKNVLKMVEGPFALVYYRVRSCHNVKFEAECGLFIRTTNCSMRETG